MRFDFKTIPLADQPKDPNFYNQAQKWAEAVEAACAEAGWPVEIVVGRFLQPTRCDDSDYSDYSWTPIIFDPIPSSERTTVSRPYEAFHRACVLMDHLRPKEMIASPKLRELLETS